MIGSSIENRENWRHALRALLAVLLTVIACGCAAPVRLNAVPEERTTDAVIPGIPAARFWVDRDVQPFIEAALESFEQEAAYLASTGHSGPLPPVSFLAVSGGGDNGAFGAGLLNGWTARGDRPEFKVVTGVSTGALIAPMAFLGPEYDDALTEAYTKVTQQDIFESRGMIWALFSDAFADTVPMAKLIERYVTPAFLEAIAAEYEKGRLLLIGTTNLDARRPIIWNMTAIAASDAPGAIELFRKVLLASSAVPGAFPPVMIDVEVDGEAYQEMHVDGGAMAQIFLYPPSLKVAQMSAELGVKRERHVYLIRNSRLDPEWADVERRTFSIAGRAISSLIHTQGLGDLYRIYLSTHRDGIDYNLAYIGADFTMKHNAEFDPEFMRALYDYGYGLAEQGYPWSKAPPGLDGLAFAPATDVSLPATVPSS